MHNDGCKYKSMSETISGGSHNAKRREVTASVSHCGSIFLVYSKTFYLQRSVWRCPRDQEGHLVFWSRVRLSAKFHNKGKLPTASTITMGFGRKRSWKSLRLVDSMDLTFWNVVNMVTHIWKLALFKESKTKAIEAKQVFFPFWWQWLKITQRVLFFVFHIILKITAFVPYWHSRLLWPEKGCVSYISSKDKILNESFMNISYSSVLRLHDLNISIQRTTFRLLRCLEPFAPEGTIKLD